MSLDDLYVKCRICHEVMQGITTYQLRRECADCASDERNKSSEHPPTHTPPTAA